MTNEHTSLEKYTSQTLFEMVAKGLCVRGELETEGPPLQGAGSHCLELQQLTPNSTDSN